MCLYYDAWLLVEGGLNHDIPALPIKACPTLNIQGLSHLFRHVSGVAAGDWGKGWDCEPKVDQTTAPAWPGWFILGHWREEPSLWRVWLSRGLFWVWRKALDWSGKTLLGSASAVCRHKNTHSSSARFRSVMVGCLRGHRVLSQKQNPESCFWVRTSLLWFFQQIILSLISLFIFLSKEWKQGALASLFAY